MSRRVYILSAILVATAGLGAYTATVASRLTSRSTPAVDDATDALLSWLNASADQRAELQKADPGFAAELKQLKADVAAQKTALASLLEKTEATNDEIMAGLEKVIATNNALERRAARYVLAVRKHLNIQQQRRLLSLCAEEVRRGRGHQWGRQQTGGDDNSSRGGGRHGRGSGAPWRVP